MPTRVMSAIDIGSNAMRILIAEMNPSHPLKVVKKLRIPVRLGKDVFLSGSISEESLQAAEKAFVKFKSLNEKYKVEKCRAVATSASREAKNGAEFTRRIFEKTGISIEIIDGIEEGLLVHKAVTHEIDVRHKKVMGIDIGGGSVEVTFSDGMDIRSTQSFPLGTVRLLDQMNKHQLGEDGLPLLIGKLIAPLSRHIHQYVDVNKIDFAVGTGGNLEALGRLKVQLLKKTPNTFLTLIELHEILDKLGNISIKQRIEKLDMKPDRADVIVPAGKVVATILRQAETDKILIPSVGLRDGILWSLVESH